MAKHLSFEAAAQLINDNAIITVSSASGLSCPDAMLKAIGARFAQDGAPKNITSLHPIAAGNTSPISPSPIIWRNN